MRHEFVDDEGRFWALLDVPEWGPRRLYIARDEPRDQPHIQYAIDDPEEENRAPVLAREVLRLATALEAERAACAELVRAAGCICADLCDDFMTGDEEAGEEFRAGAVLWRFAGHHWQIVEHDPRCPKVLAAAIEARKEG